MATAKAFQFEPKITLGGAIQIVLLLFAIVAAYFTIVARVESSQKDIGSLQLKVEPIDNLETRMALVERNQVVGREQRESFQEDITAAVAELNRQQTMILQQLAAIVARLDERDRREGGP